MFLPSLSKNSARCPTHFTTSSWNYTRFAFCHRITEAIPLLDDSFYIYMYIYTTGEEIVSKFGTPDFGLRTSVASTSSSPKWRPEVVSTSVEHFGHRFWCPMSTKRASKATAGDAIGGATPTQSKRRPKGEGNSAISVAPGAPLSAGLRVEQ